MKSPPKTVPNEFITAPDNLRLCRRIRSMGVTGFSRQTISRVAWVPSNVDDFLHRHIHHLGTPPDSVTSHE